MSHIAISSAPIALFRIGPPRANSLRNMACHRRSIANADCADHVALGQLMDRRLDRLRLPFAGALADARDAVVGEHPGEHPVAPAGADQMGLDPRNPAVAAACGHDRLPPLRRGPPVPFQWEIRPAVKLPARATRATGLDRLVLAPRILRADGRGDVGSDRRGHGRRRVHGPDLFAGAQRRVRARLACGARDPAAAPCRRVAPPRREHRAGVGLGGVERRLAGGDARRRRRPGVRAHAQRQPRRDQHRRARARQARAVREAPVQHARRRPRDGPGRDAAAGGRTRSASSIANGRRPASPAR